MASNSDFVQYVADQCSGAGDITTKKMFGEYGIYCEGKIFGLICDDCFFLKPTDAGRQVIDQFQKECILRPPYPGAKDYFYMADIDDADFLVELVRETCKELPMPKPKKNKQMKNMIITLLLALSSLTGQAQVEPSSTLLGTWSGRLNVGTVSLKLVLHLEQADGQVKATLDSPDQGAKGIPAQKEFLSDDSVAVKVEAIGMTYRAGLKDGKLVGTFSQNGTSIPLTLEPGTGEEVKRPQTPQPPFPYETEEVTFRNEADGATLAGTLTWPMGYDKKKKPAVVLLVSGSGQQNRDEELFDHKPFLVIADFLARQGIATLRYDDRATGKSVGGEVKNATSEDFMRDAAAGLDYLRNRKTFKKVGVLGHSEGGLIAFMLSAQGKTDFIISMAGPGVKGDTLLAAQSNRILTLSGLPADVTVEKYRQQPTVSEMPWLQWFINYDPSDNIRKTRCPVFALNGDRDCQVISTQNLPAIKDLLPSSEKNLIKEYAGLNHLFQHCKTGITSEYGQIEETISAEVLNDISLWILKSVK